MLVLTRRGGQSIVMRTEAGERIYVRICYVRGGVVRVGISAPENVKVLRTELAEYPPKKNEPITFLAHSTGKEQTWREKTT